MNLVQYQKSWIGVQILIGVDSMYSTNAKSPLFGMMYLCFIYNYTICVLGQFIIYFIWLSCLWWSGIVSIYEVALKLICF